MAQPAFRTETAPVADVPDAGVFRVTGRVTFDETPELRKLLLRELSKTSAAKMVVELSGVDEMDTSGAAVLAEALKVGQARGLRVFLCSPSESVMRIFRLAGFEEVLAACCPTAAETHQRLLE